ncbi:lipocalin family protein [Chryseobacterium viscerum]|uniref:Lipocalin-like domain-containing protein n=1 Tax=Chryseobacterium viscerum TaxID=1037377 RepID=A0A316WH52_9FLAO|nr:lipocalin family protein [Chryseobacterium viscerum]PWN60772.1 hypothetical protein C1634_011880 [Chryseobacterium viscerum]
MKKILAGVLGLVLLSSCGNDSDTLPIENNGNSTTSNIVGTWKIQTQYTVSGTDKTTVIKEYAPDDCKKKSTYEFRNDGKYYMTDYNSVNSGCQKAEATISYSYSSANMEVTIGNNTAKVLELSSNTFIFLVTDNEDHNNDGINDYTKYVLYK